MPGLATSEVERRLLEHGANALPEARPRPLWRRLLQQLRSPIIYILLFALVFDVGRWIYEGLAGRPMRASRLAPSSS